MPPPAGAPLPACVSGDSYRSSSVERALSTCLLTYADGGAHSPAGAAADEGEADPWGSIPACHAVGGGAQRPPSQQLVGTVSDDRGAPGWKGRARSVRVPDGGAKRGVDVASLLVTVANEVRRRGARGARA